MPKRFLGLPRAAAMAIVLTAAALMLLRPLCESWLDGAPSHGSAFEGVAMSAAAAPGHADDTSAGACCSPDGTGAASAARALHFDRDGGATPPATPLVPAAFVVLAIVAPIALRRLPLARIPRSYCLRSARILR